MEVDSVSSFSAPSAGDDPIARGREAVRIVRVTTHDHDYAETAFVKVRVMFEGDVHSHKTTPQPQLDMRGWRRDDMSMEEECAPPPPTFVHGRKRMMCDSMEQKQYHMPDEYDDDEEEDDIQEMSEEVAPLPARQITVITGGRIILPREEEKSSNMLCSSRCEMDELVDLEMPQPHYSLSNECGASPEWSQPLTDALIGGEEERPPRLEQAYQVKSPSAALPPRPPGVRTKWTRPDQAMSVCRLCQVAVPVPLRKMHIYRFHLRRALYQCPYCDFCSTYHMTNTRKHIRVIHDSKAPPLSYKHLYSKQMDALLYSCFLDRRILSSVDACVVETVQTLVDWVVEDEERERGGEGGEGREGGGEYCLEDSDWFSSTFLAGSTCNMCDMRNVKHLERHVLQHHVRRPMFLCPYCKYYTTYAISSVKLHMKTKHPDMEQTPPLDLREENREYIKRVYAACYNMAPQPIRLHEIGMR